MATITRWFAASLLVFHLIIVETHGVRYGMPSKTIHIAPGLARNSWDSRTQFVNVPADGELSEKGAFRRVRRQAQPTVNTNLAKEVGLLTLIIVV